LQSGGRVTIPRASLDALKVPIKRILCFSENTPFLFLMNTMDKIIMLKAAAVAAAT